MQESPSSLEEILAKAETATAPPPLPTQGIPKQSLPYFMRILFHLIFLPFLWLELLADKIAKKVIRPPFMKTGSCKRRGNCCHYILFPETTGLLKILFRFWSEEIHGFYSRGHSFKKDGKMIHVMGCRHLSKDGSCTNYFFRPRVCRSWPIIELFGTPKILKGCGYQIELRKSYAKKYPSLRVIEQNFSSQDE